MSGVDKGTKCVHEEIIIDTEIFIEINKYFPRMLKDKKGTLEYKLRERYNNNFREAQVKKLMKEQPELYERFLILEKMKKKGYYTDKERVTQFEDFLNEHGRKMVATADKVTKEEYNLARAYDNFYAPGKARRKKMSQELELRLSALENHPNWKNRAPSTELFEKVKMFCKEKYWFPLRTSPDSDEKYLAAGISQKKRFTKEENEQIAKLRKKYGKNKNVSFPEKIFYWAIKKIMGVEVTANCKLCGHECDINFSYGGKHYIVQYDGLYYHKTSDVKEKDCVANAAHISAKNIVIRLREKGLTNLNKEGLYAENEYKEISLDVKNFSHDTVKEVLTEIFDYIGYTTEFNLCEIWESVLAEARYESSSRRTAISAVCQYLEYILRNETTPERELIKSGGSIDNRIKKCYKDNKFGVLELEILALLESFYEPRARKRNLSWYETTGNTLDFEKGSQHLIK